MSRSLKKNPLYYVHPSILKKIGKGEKVIKTWSRSSSIIPSMVGITFLIHNGKSFTTLNVDSNHVGNHRLGEFAPTRKIGKPGKKGNRRK